MRGFVLASVLTLSGTGVSAAFEQPRETVEHFLDLLGELRFYALEQHFTENANVTTARATKSGFVTHVVTAQDWLDEMKRDSSRQPFRERLTNVDVSLYSGELAVLTADFTIARETGTTSSGVDVFTLVRKAGAWKISSIAFTSIPESLTRQESMSLEARVAAKLDALLAKSSLYAKHLPTGREVAVRADEPMNTLSVIKIPIMLLAYRDAEAGKLDLDARYRVKPEDRRRGSGLIQTFAPGLEPTYRDIITQMIITSDNTATDIMIARLGLDRVNALLAELGYDETRLLATTGELFRRVWEIKDPAHVSLSHAEVFEMGFPDDEAASERRFAFEGDPKEWLGRSTAREMSRLLEQIHNGALASRASSDEMIRILRRQFYSSRLPRFIRFEAGVAHKTGDWPPVAGNDVGILYYDGGPTVVSVFVNQNRGDFTRVEEAIGEIARELVQAWSADPEARP